MELKKIVRRIGRKFGLIKKSELNWHYEEPAIKLSKNRKKKLKEKGFLACSDLLFDFPKFGYEYYVNHRDYKCLHPINGSFSKLIDNKAFVPVLFKNELDLIPDLCISIDNGIINYAYGIEWNGGSINLLLEKSLEIYNELILKPVYSSGGSNIIFLNPSNLDSYLDEIYKNDTKLLINNSLKNEDYSSNIYGKSINTIRVIFYKSKKRVNRIFNICHRFGTNESGKVDNCSKGGMLSSIDISTGRLKKAVIFESKNEKNNKWYDSHINTGARIDGIVIPDWEIKIAMIDSIINKLDYLDYGGIDFAPTNAGLKILEINSMPGIDLAQIDSPALINEEFKQFLYSKGYPQKP